MMIRIILKQLIVPSRTKTNRITKHQKGLSLTSDKKKISNHALFIIRSITDIDRKR